MGCAIYRNELDVNDTERRSGALRYGKTRGNISGNNTDVVSDRGCAIVGMLGEASEVLVLEVEEVMAGVNT